MTDGTPKLEIRDRDRIGQVIVPIPKVALLTMTVEQLATTYVPIALATAKEHGGTLTGTPEILRADEILPRMADADPTLREAVEDAADRSVFVLATMVPHDWSRFDRGDIDTAEFVMPAVRHPSDN